MTKQIYSEIYGEEFETYVIDNYDYLHNVTPKTLEQCYECPSMIKRGIYEAWREWAIKANVSNFGIISYNIFKFTLYGELKDAHGYIVGYLIITKDHNKLYLI